eukprot:762550-Hanusia_phi.AAC.4
MTLDKNKLIILSPSLSFPSSTVAHRRHLGGSYWKPSRVPRRRPSIFSVLVVLRKAIGRDV